MVAPVVDPLGPRDETAVGFIGLGHLGTAIAGHLAGHPGGLVVCEARPSATAALAEAGAPTTARWR